MKKILIGIGLFLSGIIVYGQQNTHYSMYMANPYLINPAMAGSEDFVDIKAGTRQQWVGVLDAPQTYYLTGHGAIGRNHNIQAHYSDRKNWLGIGGTLVQDQTGVLSSTNGLATVSYDLGLTKGDNMRGYLIHHDGIRAIVGLSLGILQYSYDPSKFHFERTKDMVIADPTLAGSSKTSLDGNLGGWLYQEGTFFLGFSVLHMFGNKMLDNVNSSGRFDRLYYLTGGYDFRLSQHMYFYPSFVVRKTLGVPYNIDVNAKIEYDHGKLWGGLSYRHNDAIAILLGTVINYRYEIGYAFDVTTSVLRKADHELTKSSFLGTHELMLGYRILYKAHDVTNPLHGGKQMKKHKYKH